MLPDKLKYYNVICEIKAAGLIELAKCSTSFEQLNVSFAFIHKNSQ